SVNPNVMITCSPPLAAVGAAVSVPVWGRVDVVHRSGLPAMRGRGGSRARPYGRARDAHGGRGVGRATASKVGWGTPRPLPADAVLGVRSARRRAGYRAQDPRG